MKRALSRHRHPTRSSNIVTYPWYQVVQKTGASEDTTDAPPSLSFGTPLDEANQTSLLQLISHMNTYVEREGLFRKSGNKGRMEQLVKGLAGGEFGSVALEGTYNPHDYASVLKQYFSELPEPLLLKRHLHAYIQAAGECSSLGRIFIVEPLNVINTPLIIISLVPMRYYCQGNFAGGEFGVWLKEGGGAEARNALHSGKSYA
jgi:hypothetical protein